MQQLFLVQQQGKFEILKYLQDVCILQATVSY